MWPGARDARQPEPLGPADGRDVGRQAEQHAAEGLHRRLQADSQGPHGLH